MEKVDEKIVSAMQMISENALTSSKTILGPLSHTFFNAMMHFESASAFSNFTKQGHSVVMTVPTGVGTSNIIAACSFIISTDGLFVDAIAVSDGSGGCLKRSDASFTDSSLKVISSISCNNPGFQLFGIGKFLLTLLFRFAHTQCEPPVVYLKTNQALRDFYLRSGYQTFESLPPLFEITKSIRDLCINFGGIEKASRPPTTSGLGTKPFSIWLLWLS
jgi:hypothetical protein